MVLLQRAFGKHTRAVATPQLILPANHSCGLPERAGGSSIEKF
jgi:hypothetical protein